MIKPRGPTSHDVVMTVRRIVPGTKVGHAGTLDPGASGVVVLCLGAYTRLVSLVQATEKEYEGVVLFGRSTDTFDLDGRTVRRSPVPNGLPERVMAASALFAGSFQQDVPRFSAAKWEGKALCRWARSGIETPRRHKTVHVHAVEVWPTGRSRRRFGFRLVTGSGFYVRSWANDLGQAVGVPAVLARLCRTRVGPFTLTEAVPLEKLDATSLPPSVRTGTGAVPWIPAVTVDPAAFAQLCHGAPQVSPPDSPEGVVAVLDAQGKLGLVAQAGGGLLQPQTVLCGAEARQR